MINTVEVTGPFTADHTANVGQLVQVDPTGGAFAINLPNAKFCKGQSVRVVNVSSSTTAVTVTARFSQTINGTATLAMTTAYGSKNFTSNGSNWLAY